MIFLNEQFAKAWMYRTMLLVSLKSSLLLHMRWLALPFFIAPYCLWTVIIGVLCTASIFKKVLLDSVKARKKQWMLSIKHGERF